MSRAKEKTVSFDWKIPTLVSFSFSLLLVLVYTNEGTCLGELFAVSPVREGSVEPVVDSKRYFVLRIENGNKHAFVGMGLGFFLFFLFFE